jgi:hypothetical protein
MRRALHAAAALIIGLATAAPARAQNNPPRPGFSASDLRPLLVREPVVASLSQHPVAPLTSAQLDRLRRAQGSSAAGLYERARAELVALLSEAPHHPIVLTELARTELALEDYAAVERLGRAERVAQRDSLLLGHELSLALERLGRARDAAAIAIEEWAAAPVEAEWAADVVDRMAGVDLRGVRDLMRRAALALPERTDLVQPLARLEWRLGDVRAALRALSTAERADPRARFRWTFAEERMKDHTTRDSTAATETLLDLAADARYDPAYRTAAARRAWDVIAARADQRAFAPRMLKALADLPPARWSPDLRVGVARGLRELGRTNEARALLQPDAGARDLRSEFELERSLADLRDGPPERALPALRKAAEDNPALAYRYAEALFYAGQVDSAHAWYQRIADNPEGSAAGAALERLYLIEDGTPREALVTFGRIAYESWRGETRRAGTLTDSLVRVLPRGALWAQAALLLSAQRAGAGDDPGALEPLLAIADSLPGDRLAPVARERAGDLYLAKLKDEAHAAGQWEECLARYPKAWNAAAVRRKLEALRRDRRF